jgi:hypothetical protein
VLVPNPMLFGLKTGALGREGVGAGVVVEDCPLLILKFVGGLTADGTLTSVVEDEPVPAPVA